MQVTSNKNDITLPVREVIEKLRRGELTMDELSSDAQTMVKKRRNRDEKCQEG